MKIEQSFKRYAMLLLGAAILAFGLYNVHAQSRITEGGVLGATLLIHHFTGISPSISEIVIDIICYALGVKFLGKSFLKYAAAATLSFAGFYAIFEWIGYVLPDMSGVPLLAAVVGGIFVGTGVGLVVRAGGAAGGDDALALVLSKLFRCNVSFAYFLTDFVVLMLSLSYIPVRNIVCSLVTVTLSSFIIGRIHKQEDESEKA